jgi:hypothetical protein
MYQVNQYGVRFTYNNDIACPSLDAADTTVPADAHCPHIVGMLRYMGSNDTNTDPQDGPACPPPSVGLDTSAVDAGCLKTLAIYNYMQ